MARPALSVVIPTFNRAQLLERTLASLQNQVGMQGGIEIIVVDDGSTDRTPELMQRIPGVVYVRQENAGPAAARNNGWSRARADIVAFTDDDTVPAPTWLADLKQAFEADPSLDAAGGTVRPLRLSFLTRFAQAEQHASHGVGVGGEIKYLVTANCAYRRKVLVALGGFDESFPGASGEDTDLTLRAQAAGCRMRLLDGAVVLHDHPSHLLPILKAYVKHGRSRRLVIDRNPSSAWGRGRREALSMEHWRRRYRSYRACGLGRFASIGALAIRVLGLVAYTGGIAQSIRSRPAQSTTKKVMIACPGADHVARGYERVTRELAVVLGSDSALRVLVVKGSGPASGDIVLPSLRRDRPMARTLSRLVSPGRGVRPGTPGEDSTKGSVLRRLVRRTLTVTPYDVEAATFGLSLLGLVAMRRPDVLILQDVPTARVVALGRRCFRRLRVRVIFINGAPWPAPYAFADVVQHVTPVSWGDDPGLGWKKVLLPLGTTVPTEVRHARPGTRARYGIAAQDKVVVSVGTLLEDHKRHMYLLREIARLPEPRPFLVIAGAPDVDQRRIEEAATQLLGLRQRVLEVDPDEVGELLACADAFVLASLHEGFGLVYLEALAAGLPTIVHDGRLQRWLLGPFGTYVDMTQTGALADRLGDVLNNREQRSLGEARRHYVDDRFSWRALRDDYVAMVHCAAGGDR